MLQRGGQLWLWSIKTNLLIKILESKTMSSWEAEVEQKSLSIFWTDEKFEPST